MSNVKWDDPVSFPIVAPATNDYVMGIDNGFTQNQKSLANRWVLASSLAAGIATFLGTPSSANLLAAMTTSTGTGLLVFGTGPTISAPTITGHPTIEGVTSTGATGTGNIVFSVAPTITGHPTIEGVTSAGATGTGNFVFSISPTLSGTPVLGAATATSINKVTLTAPATGSTLTILDGKTLTVDNSLEFAGTDSTKFTFPGVSDTVACLATANVFTAAQTISAASLTFSGNQSASGLFSTSGIREKGVAATFTDTQASTTVATAYTNVFAGNTWNASNTITVTNAFNTYFNDPIQGTATLTNKWALGADSIKVGTSNSFSVSTTGVINGNTLTLTSGFSGVGITGLNIAAGSIPGSSTYIGFQNFPVFTKLSASSIVLGYVASASPIAHTITIGESSRSGTDTNVGGASGTVRSGQGTGTGTASSLIFQTPVVVASGTGAQTQTTQLTLNSTGATFVPQVIHGLPENLKAYTVGTLPTGNPGDYAYVTDDTLSTWNSTLTGGSTGYTPVFKNATVWVSV